MNFDLFHCSWIMIVCTVLSVKPYSGLYDACKNCMGKVLSDQENRWWCRKCKVTVTRSDVQQRYCISMVVTDHSTAPQNVVVFGKSCDPIFGCSANHFAEYLSDKRLCNANDLLYKAISTALIGKCFGLVLCTPPNIKQQTNFSGIMKLDSEPHTGQKKELVVREIKVLCNDCETVLSNLHLELDPSILQNTPCSNTPVLEDTVSLCESSDDSNFFFNSSHSSYLPSQEPLLLETYAESPETLSLKPLSHRNDSIIRQQEIPKNSDHSKMNQSEGQQQDLYEGEYPPQVVSLSKEAIAEYLSELSSNDWLVRELESDWELSQHKHPSPPSIQHWCTHSQSKKMLRELQEPFSREGSPNCSNYQTPLTSSASSLSSTQHAGEHSQCCMISPELFYSVSSTHNRSRTLLGSLSSQSLLQTPSQLLFDSRRVSSPELFESSLTEQVRESGSGSQQLLQTPSLASRVKPGSLRRKLVQGTLPRNMPALVSAQHSPCAPVYQSPSTTSSQSSPLVENHNAHSPDIL